MKNIKAGYVVHGELKNFTSADANMLDVINIAFAGCKDSAVYFEHDDDMKKLTEIRGFNPDLKIVLSVGGWGAGGFSIMSASESTRKKFALSCVEAVKKYNLDGIDIDWEYPGIDWAGIDASPDDKKNFTTMLRIVREKLDAYKKDLLLTIAVGCDSYYTENTEMDKVAEILDYVSVMTYDMRGCGDCVTGHHTNLLIPEKTTDLRSRRSVERSVEIYTKAGVPSEKLIIGIAMYSRMWKNVASAGNNGLGQPAEAGNYGPSYGEISEKYLKDKSFTEYFDETAKAPYLFDGSTFISYDNEKSIAAKCKYVKENNLLGVMYWEHGCDPTRKLLKAIFENL